MLVCKVVIKKLPFALDYMPMPDTVEKDYPCGTIVEVPYRSASVAGVVVLTTQSLSVAKDKVKAIISISDNRIDIESVADFYARFSHYYGASMAELLSMVVPKSLWTLKALSPLSWLCALTMKPSHEGALTKSAQKLFRWLRSRESVRFSQLLDEGFKAVTIQQCFEKMAIGAGPSPSMPLPALPVLSPEQESAFDKMVASPSGVHYVNGVTGSGKTYLYIAIARYWVDLGGQVLMLVPEIGLTPQLYKKMLVFFAPSQVAMLHSGLSDQQRAHVWKECSRGDIKLLIGTRSALFTPMHKLSAIIIDEEHDPSYKQVSQIRYSARGAAFMRARASQCQLVLGSATPSLACLKLITDNRLSQHCLASRYTDVQMPRVNILPIHEQKCQVGFSQEALLAIKDTLLRNKRVLVFLNRRGYAPCLWCPDCDHSLSCPGCDRPYTYHQKEQNLACHRCKTIAKLSRQCDQCGADTCIPLGQGTEKVTRFLQERHPDVPVIKMDKDTCKTWSQLAATLESIHHPGCKIIVATQMMVKGHHIEDLDTVIVMESDQSLLSKDFKAQEGLLLQMGQVIGRSGRGQERGVVYIQTKHQDHPLWSYIVGHRYNEAGQYLMAQRRQYQLPPYTYQLAVHFSATSMEKAHNRGLVLLQVLKRSCQGCTVMGPMPSLMAKLNGQHRSLLLFQSCEITIIQSLVHVISSLRRSDRRFANVIIERDPVEV